MRPTDILSSEHRVIEQVLDCLEALADRADEGGRLDVERAENVLEILRTFADRCHHGKEEEHLFPMLVARGMSTEIGPIAVMLDDHRAGREFIRQMHEASSDENAERFVPAARSFAVLLRDHIAKEDHVLFPTAESMLDEPAREALLHAFRTFEHDDMGEGTHARMIALADDLARYYDVPFASERSPSPGVPGGCSHGLPCN